MDGESRKTAGEKQEPEKERVGEKEGKEAERTLQVPTLTICQRVSATDKNCGNIAKDTRFISNSASEQLRTVFIAYSPHIVSCSHLFVRRWVFTFVSHRHGEEL